MPKKRTTKTEKNRETKKQVYIYKEKKNNISIKCNFINGELKFLLEKKQKKRVEDKNNNKKIKKSKK
jgi:hypothetical protein